MLFKHMPKVYYIPNNALSVYLCLFNLQHQYGTIAYSVLVLLNFFVLKFLVTMPTVEFLWLDLISHVLDANTKSCCGLLKPFGCNFKNPTFVFFDKILLNIYFYLYSVFMILKFYQNKSKY